MDCEVQGLTAWQCAVQDGNTEMMKALLWHGANVNAKLCQVMKCGAQPCATKASSNKCKCLCPEIDQVWEKIVLYLHHVHNAHLCT